MTDVYRLSLRLESDNYKGKPEYDLNMIKFALKKETTALYVVDDGMRTRQVRKDDIGRITQHREMVRTIDFRSYTTGENLEEVIASLKEKMAQEVAKRTGVVQIMNQLVQGEPNQVVFDDNNRYRSFVD